MQVLRKSKSLLAIATVLGGSWGFAQEFATIQPVTHRNRAAQPEMVHQAMPSVVQSVPSVVQSAPSVVQSVPAAPIQNSYAKLQFEDNDPDPGYDTGHIDQSVHLYADFLYMRARGISVPFGQIQDGVGNLAVPRGPAGVVDFDFDTGIRAGGELALDCRTALQGSFTYFDTDATATLNVPNGQPFVIRSLATHPNTLNAAADSLSASAAHNLNLLLADIDLKVGLCNGQNFYSSLFFGGRYAQLDQDFVGTYTLLGTTTVGTGIEFMGGGPRVGIEAEYGWCCGMFVKGRGAASLIYGEFDASYIQQNVFSGVQAETAYSDDRLVPILELELGVGWRNESDCFRVSVGYNVTSWVNMMTTPTWVEGVRGGGFTTNGDNLRDTMTFDGLFARVEFRF